MLIFVGSELMGSMGGLLRPDVRVVSSGQRSEVSPPGPDHVMSLTPIGLVRSPLVERADAPRQPRLPGAVDGVIQLFPGHGYEDALSDLDQWDHIWVLFWFHRNVDYRPKVQPPRSAVKRGVLATRAPYRPNPIGMSALRLLRVEGLQLHVAALDLLDGTPVLDVKPYVPYTDAIPEANHGWLDLGEVEAKVRPADPVTAYQVSYAPLALEQLAFLAEAGAELKTRIDASLALGPSPHAYRRIKQVGEGYVLAVKDWRAAFRADGRLITVQELKSGYRPAELCSAEGEAPASHKAFVSRWPVH
jgi:tRNA-Thr(GGU) m(6)t(6)A37 methyltransferase TsaA